MANEKIINTRIALRTGDFAYWTTGAGKDLSLYKGEVCICTVATTDNQATTAPTVLFKVANANGQKFADLNWVSGLAADVYAWAKKETPDWNDFPKLPLEVVDNGTGKFVTDFTYADNKLTITRSDVAWNDIQNKPDLALKSEIPTELGVMSVTAGDETITVGGDGKDVTIKVTANKFDAYGAAAAVEAKLPTSADYGVLEVKPGTGIEVTGDAQHPVVGVKANTYDAYGAAEAVLGTSSDAATANTVYGAKAAAAAAQSDATIAKTKIETFLGTVTPDGSQDIIDTLTEINNYVGEHGEEFVALSEKVTKIENGTTATTANAVTQDLEETIKGWTIGGAIWAETAANAEKFGGQEPSYYATAEALSQAVANVPSTKVNNAVHADTAAKATDADNATKAADADKLGGQLPSYYATAEALNTVSQTANDVKTHASTNAGLIQENTNRIKALEDANHISEVTTTENGGLKVTNKNQIDIDDEVVFVLNCNW